MIKWATQADAKIGAQVTATTRYSDCGAAVSVQAPDSSDTVEESDWRGSPRGHRPLTPGTDGRVAR